MQYFPMEIIEFGLIYNGCATIEFKQEVQNPSAAPLAKQRLNSGRLTVQAQRAFLSL